MDHIGDKAINCRQPRNYLLINLATEHKYNYNISATSLPPTSPCSFHEIIIFLVFFFGKSTRLCRKRPISDQVNNGRLNIINHTNILVC